MTDVKSPIENLKNRGSEVRTDLEKVADAAMDLVGKHLEVTVKKIVRETQAKLKLYLVPILVVIPFFVFAMINLVYKVLVIGLSTVMEKSSVPELEITASAIILVLTLAASCYYYLKLKPRPKTAASITALEGGS